MYAVMCQLPGHVGVCNGRLGNNLPSERDVVELYKANGIKRMRIYDPNPDTLTALRGSDIELILDVPNSDLPSIQSDASQWRVEFVDKGLEYRNLFDAMVDGVYHAMEKAGGRGVGVVVSESGWPSGGGGRGGEETVANAETYYRNLIGHVGGGTPKKKGEALETYLFAMFDENEKPGSKTEQHFGLFSPDKTPKYKLGLKSG
ncbi:glucan endo-1,3-beta-glucosidase-like [Salvia divinorum]|uniref:Glucan endo-1,3-beta-glucosidase-like n=1 Tax=Salvia divinorum TaxID=28513 RepID=A0ABD1H936_SALDI